VGKSTYVPGEGSQTTCIQNLSGSPKWRPALLLGPGNNSSGPGQKMGSRIEDRKTHQTSTARIIAQGALDPGPRHTAKRGSPQGPAAARLRKARRLSGVYHGSKGSKRGLFSPTELGPPKTHLIVRRPNGKIYSLCADEFGVRADAKPGTHN